LWKLAWIGLALSLLITALSFPVSGASGAALLAFVGVAGAAIASVAPRVAFRVPAWAQDLLLASIVCAVSARLFNRSWNDSGYRIYDWAAHHAILKHLVDGLRQGHIPTWVHSVSTGDSPYELYAFLPYYIAARAALWTECADLTLVLVRSAIFIHTLAALGSALLTRRVVAWPWGIVVGLATLCDIGSVWGGGIEGLFAMGVTHSALAQALWSFALIAVLSWLARPSWWRAAGIWSFVALAIACHPLSLVSALAALGALGLVAVLAVDVPRRELLLAMLHVVLGVLLVAFVWAPFSQRLLLYGVHYGLPPQPAGDQFSHILASAVPEATLEGLVYAGYVGVLVALVSRRAAPTLIASFAAILMAGLFDQLYTLLDLIPSLSTARFQMVRLPSSAKPAIYICGVYLVDSALARARIGRGESSSISPARERSRAVLGALLALATFALVRCVAPYFDRLSQDVRWLADREVPDKAGLVALAAWAREQNAAQSPDRYGRLWDQDERRTFLVYHVNAESGLPTLWLGPTQPLFFLRDRIEDASSASLRRFNVRWVMRADRPPSLGDPKTERRFGRYIVRELPSWDGQFARIERGQGQVVVKNLDDERVVVELTGTTEPALVALGTGYYPRWQATHATSGALPVYALPSFDGARLNVVAAWLPPGETTFSPSGPLPSDTRGRVPTALALLGIAAFLARGRLATRGLTRLEAWTRGTAWIGRHAERLAIGAVGSLVLAAFVAGFLASRRPARALQIGNGLRAGARVEIRSAGGPWQRCRYTAWSGTFRCPGRVVVRDVVASLLNDAPPSLPFNVPAIEVSAGSADDEVALTLEAPLEGEYWAGTSGGSVRLAIPGELDATVSDQQSSHHFRRAEGAREITLTAPVPAKGALRIAFVQRERLDPERAYPRAPDEAPAVSGEASLGE
jgi:hypothetical protein